MIGLVVVSGLAWTCVLAILALLYGRSRYRAGLAAGAATARDPQMFRSTGRIMNQGPPFRPRHAAWLTIQSPRRP